MITSSNIQQVNSTSYADVVGLQLGLPRLVGEDTPTYLKRLSNAAGTRRDHSYEGMLEQIALRLGLEVYPGIQVTSTDIGTLISCAMGAVTVTSSAGVQTVVPTCVIDVDTYIEWRSLADVTADLNQIPGITATLAQDGWGIQIANQSNVFLVPSETINGQEQQLAHSEVVLSSVLFNQTVLSYTISAAGELALGAPPPPGLTITYEYQAFPYNIVCSDVGLFSLTDPAIAKTCITADGVPAYQILEFINTVMSQDRSYWSE